MICIQDKQSEEIISQVYNFIDHMGGKESLNVQGVERFMIVRGIIEEDKATS
jgi:hypothetical protein